jgi:hypothetical protein
MGAADASLVLAFDRPFVHLGRQGCVRLAAARQLPVV